MRWLALLCCLAACSKNASAPLPEPAPVEDQSAKAAPTPAGVGAPCRVGTDCASGVCEGEGCDDNALGMCTDELRMCTADIVDYCGCDGQTFQSSSACANQRFEHRGSCESKQ